ncbi:MAG: tetratricopeptide repeat protein [Candidatus Riflebacteria bacterium]|nr:tetratricopeptide repeat protein [Candidatus Riflebacteria bacterium]
MPRIFLIGFIVFFQIFALTESLSAKSRSSSKSSDNSSTSTEKKKKREIRKPSENSEKFLESSWSAFETGTPSEKKETIKKVKSWIRAHPDDGGGYYYLGIMLAETGPSSEAIQNLHTALSYFPNSPDVMLKLAEVLISEGEGEEELAGLLDKALSIQPNNPAALSMSGMRALATGNKKAAFDFLNKAVEQDPENPNTLRELGRLLIDMGNPKDAYDNLRKAILLDDSDPESHWLAGKALEILGKVSESADEFAKAKKLGRNDLHVEGLVGYDLARSLSQAGRNDEAIKEYRKMIRTSTDPKTGYLELGALFEGIGKSEKALDIYQKAFEKLKLPEAAFHTAEIYRNDRDNANALEWLGKISTRRDEWGEKARKEITEIKQENDQSRHDKLMEAAVNGPDDTKERALKALLMKDKTDKEALLGLKELAIEKGDLGAAIWYIKELKKAGHLTEWEADSQTNDLMSKQEQGEDIAKFESRLDDFQNHGEYDKALLELGKIKARTESTYEYWKHFSTKSPEEREYKKKMTNFYKEKIKELTARGKQIREAKKWHGK